MIVTINTDASFTRKHKRGTYAFWAICNEYKLTMSGVLKGNILKSEIAEFQCILNALYMVLSKQTSEYVGRIVINTDCLNVIHLINNDAEKIKRYELGKWGKPYVDAYFELLKSKDFFSEKIVFKHIKSHVHTLTPRNFVNQWCDNAAKHEMNRLLNRLNKEQQS